MLSRIQFAFTVSFHIIFPPSPLGWPCGFLATAMVALGTTFSAFWIMVNNSWIQAPVGYTIRNGLFVPTDRGAIIFSPWCGWGFRTCW